MNAIDNYIEQIRQSVKGQNIRKIYLFGSFAYGSPHEESDIDLLVITNDEFTPSNFEEHSRLFLKVSKVIRPVKKKIAVDLIVQTLPMFRQFIADESPFSQEIISKGKVIYEGKY